MRLTSRGRRVVVLLALAGVVGVAQGVRSLTATPTPAGAPLAVLAPVIPRPGWEAAVPATLPELTRTSAGDPASLAAAAAAALLERASLVVLAPPDDVAARSTAAELARRLRAPLLEGRAPRVGGPAAGPPDDGGDLRRLLDDLRTRTVVAVGDVGVPSPDVSVRRVRGAGSVAVADLLEQAGRSRPRTTGVAVLVRGDDPAVGFALLAAAAAGHEVVTATAADPRAQPAQAALAGVGPGPTVLLGPGWDDVDDATLRWQLAVARTGAELPGGGQLLFPDRRLVALYGNPQTAALGVLGEQPVDAAVVRVREVAAAYADISDVPVVPTFELIATVASAGAEPTGDYSRRTPVAALRAWVDAAEAAGLYVVLDLQSGHTDLLTQAREYESLLIRPHVGLALDPEWRLLPGQRHLSQIGAVDAHEVNGVAEWLAGLVRTHALPQKLLLVHQFRTSMIRDRSALHTGRPELAVAIQMDGQGGQDVKLDSWRAITTGAPPGTWWGWKNFYDEDPVVRSPADVLSLTPEVHFVSYQ